MGVVAFHRLTRRRYAQRHLTTGLSFKMVQSTPQSADDVDGSNEDKPQSRILTKKMSLFQGVSRNVCFYELTYALSGVHASTHCEKASAIGQVWWRRLLPTPQLLPETVSSAKQVGSY